MSAALPRSFRLHAGAGTLRLDPRDETFFADPYPAYAAILASAPLVFWHEAGCLAAFDQPRVAALLRDRRLGRILPAGADGRPDYADMPAHLANFYAIEAHSLLDLEPPTHSRIRGLVTRAFVSRQIERLAPRIAGLAETLIDRFSADGTVELVGAFAEPLPVRVIAELIGVGADDTAALLDWSHRMVAMYQFGRTEAVEHAADAAARDFAAFMREAIAHKRARPGDDLVSGLVAAESEGGHLSEAEMVSTLLLLMNAGHEATVHQIGNAVAAILRSGIERPDRLLADAASGARLVEEAVRFDTPLHLFRRVALEPMDLGGGRRLERGEAIALVLGAANRDPAVYQEPDRFDPLRTGPAPVSFGGGIHFCIGAPLARLELRLALRALFARLPGLRLAGPVPFRDSYHFRGVERLDLAFDAVRSR